MNLHIHHFIVSAGLKELIEECFPRNLITWTFGCRYVMTKEGEGSEETILNVPVFCMDETMKTRSIFEISKGTFNNPQQPLNNKVSHDRLWAPFENMIYVGDGPTDIPSLSLVRSRGGLGVVVFNNNEQEASIPRGRLKQMVLDSRSDLITPANYSTNGDLFEFIKVRCYQILQRYEASDIKKINI